MKRALKPVKLYLGIFLSLIHICKTAINHYGMEVIGIHSGFQGLLTKDVESFTDKSLSGLLNLGGTMLGLSLIHIYRGSLHDFIV